MFLRITSALCKKEKDTEFVADFEEAEIEGEEDNDKNLCQDAQDQPVVIIDDYFANDFAEAIAKSAEEDSFHSSWAEPQSWTSTSLTSSPLLKTMPPKFTKMRQS